MGMVGRYWKDVLHGEDGREVGVGRRSFIDLNSRHDTEKVDMGRCDRELPPLRLEHMPTDGDAHHDSLVWDAQILAFALKGMWRKGFCPL
jgi:hypothetical protein